jgi:hypothetical protein
VVADSRRIADLTVDELEELLEDVIRRAVDGRPKRRRKRVRPVDADVEITDTDRAAAARIARKLGMHVRNG